MASFIQEIVEDKDTCRQRRVAGLSLNAIVKAFFLATMIIVLTVSPALSADQNDGGDYKDYRPRSARVQYFRIAFDEESITITVPEDEGESHFTFALSAREKSPDHVRLGPDAAFTLEGLEIGGRLLTWDRIVDLRVRDNDGTYTVVAYRSAAEETDVGRIRRGNRIHPFENVVIEDGEFVRGFVLSVTGNVDVFGEVSKDIVSLFGDVFVGAEAVVRGDIATVAGRVEIAREASVYGDVLSDSDRQEGRSRRFYRDEEEGDFEPWLVYNRVDGLAVGLEFTYRDYDSLLPFVKVWGGYALESERLRLGLEVEQTVSRALPLSVGGTIFKELMSEDDWLISRGENTAFALLVTEDFRDYYEAVGGEIFIRSAPIEHLQVQAAYEYNETNWLRSYRSLWSLFGGGKLFPRNYHRVEPALRSVGIAEVDSTENTFVTISADYDARDKVFPFEESSWAASGWLEIAQTGLGGDFDYHRYMINLRRYQEINRHTMLILRGVLGNSDGYVPVYKRFFLGGLGTLRGYKHKELIGTRFWMVNGEYRFRFPKTDLALSLLYDIGQIANDRELNGDVEVDHSLGVGLYLGDDVRLMLSRRLDAAVDKDLQFYARFEYTF